MTPLRQRMTEDMGIRNLSPLTIKLYIDAVVKFSKFFYKSPALLGPEEVRTYQLYLINQKKASWSAFNIAVSALRFLYAVTLKTDWAFEKIPYAKRPRKKPVILSLEEVCAFTPRPRTREGFHLMGCGRGGRRTLGTASYAPDAIIWESY